MVERMPDRPEFRRRDEFALHEAAGRLVLEGQALFDRLTVELGDFGQNGGPGLLVEFLDDLGGVIPNRVPGSPPPDATGPDRP